MGHVKVGEKDSGKNINQQKSPASVVQKPGCNSDKQISATEASGARGRGWFERGWCRRYGHQSGLPDSRRIDLSRHKHAKAKSPVGGGAAAVKGENIDVARAGPVAHQAGRSAKERGRDGGRAQVGGVQLAARRKRNAVAAGAGAG